MSLFFVFDPLHRSMSWKKTKLNKTCPCLNLSAGLHASFQCLKSIGIVENDHGGDIFKGELLTPKSLGERSIRVRVRDGAQEFLVPIFTVGIPIGIDLSSLKFRSYFCALCGFL